MSGGTFHFFENAMTILYPNLSVEKSKLERKFKMKEHPSVTVLLKFYQIQCYFKDLTYFEITRRYFIVFLLSFASKVNK